MTLSLSDKFDRDLGTVSSLRDIDGGTVGRFSPGQDFGEVEALFAKCEAHFRGSADSAEEIYSLLVELEPKVIDEKGEATSFLAAIIERTPKGLMVTLVEKND